MPVYKNADPRHVPHSPGKVFRWAVLDRITRRRKIAPLGPPAPRVAPDVARILDPAGPPRVTWIGHASFLVQGGGGTILIDPVFSNRIAGVIPRAGEPGLKANDLPPLDAIAVTHNHYDHLDAASIAALPRSVPVLSPEGLGAWFRRRGFVDVREMRWWDTQTIGALRLTFVPARHWSRRRPWDTNRSWWGGYVVESAAATIYHAGDSAWTPGFAEIGARFPAIDLAMLPIGAYEPPWFMEWFHLNPEQAGEAFLALGARAMVPMHWGAFRLTDESLAAPVERLRRWWDANRPGGSLHVMAVGETLAVR